MAIPGRLFRGQYIQFAPNLAFAPRSAGAMATIKYTVPGISRISPEIGLRQGAPSVRSCVRAPDPGRIAVVFVRPEAENDPPGTRHGGTRPLVVRRRHSQTCKPCKLRIIGVMSKRNFLSFILLVVADEKKAADKKDEEKAEAVTQPRMDVRDEVKKLNARWWGWAYLLPEYRLNSLNKRRADFLQRKPVAKQ